MSGEPEIDKNPKVENTPYTYEQGRNDALAGKPQASEIAEYKQGYLSVTKRDEPEIPHT